MTTQPKVLVHELSVVKQGMIRGLVEHRVASRLFEADATLWGESAEAEAAVRLGWVEAPQKARALLPEISDLLQRFAQQNVDRFVLCGMGGSSLAPEVITKAASVDLTILDSTHPDTIRRIVGHDPTRTAVFVSSKSGSTVETRSHLQAFVQRFADAGIDAAQRIVIITDPGSPLEREARQAGMHVVLADPNVGGRFSALTAFGLVPSGVAGADVERLIDEAAAVQHALRTDDADNPAFRLAVSLMPDETAADEAALPGAGERDYVRYLLEGPSATGIGEWIEQLIAESTGKAGVGVLPVVLQTPPAKCSSSSTGSAFPSGRLVALNVGDRKAAATGGTDAPGAHTPHGSVSVTAPLGAQFLLWEAATAILGRLLEVNPFDQPDVESAKSAARAALEASRAAHNRGSSPTDGTVQAVDANFDSAHSAHLEKLRQSIPPGGYLAIQAYLDRRGALIEPLEELRSTLATAWNIPVTLGWGPRFLHSTGQFHKGGPPIGGFLQLLDTLATEAETSHADQDFARLIDAQASGDRKVLTDAGRPLLALRLSDPVKLVSELTEHLRSDYM